MGAIFPEGLCSRHKQCLRERCQKTLDFRVCGNDDSFHAAGFKKIQLADNLPDSKIAGREMLLR